MYVSVSSWHHVMATVEGDFCRSIFVLLIKDLLSVTWDAGCELLNLQFCLEAKEKLTTVHC